MVDPSGLGWKSFHVAERSLAVAFLSEVASVILSLMSLKMSRPFGFLTLGPLSVGQDSCETGRPYMILLDINVVFEPMRTKPDRNVQLVQAVPAREQDQAGSRVERFHAILSRSSISLGVRMIIRPHLARRIRTFLTGMGVAARFVMRSFLGS
jgi:hypothetical protein